MMKKDKVELYTPTPAEIMVARSIDGLLGLLMTGKLDGIGMCAAHKNGEPTFFYLNTADKPVLRGPINRLLGLYEAGQSFKGLSNAPPTNRSYQVH